MKLDYDLLIAETPLPRQERINIGLLIWHDGLPEIRADVSERRLAALDPNWPRLPIFRALIDGTLQDSLRRHLGAIDDMAARRAMLDFLLTPMKAVCGGELFDTEGDFEPAIERALRALVTLPEPTVKPARTKPRGSRLDTQLRAWLRGAKLMGRHMDDLSKGRVVAQFPVSVEADVYADFAFKNGALNVIETLDLRGADHVTPALRNMAAYKSLTLDMAREAVGEDGRRLGVIAAGDYQAMRSAVRIFERNADEVFAIDSPADAQRLADLLAQGLHLPDGLSLTGLV